MSRIERVFRHLAEKNEKALIPFITAGDPDAASTLAIAHSLVDAGANIIELGIPFSDPMADGPVIQRANQRALSNGMSLSGVLEIVRNFRITDQNTPIVLMGYLNPFEQWGYEKFMSDASMAGVDGLIIVDLPPEESKDIKALAVQNGIDIIYLLAPTSSSHRIQTICAAASGFIYYVSLKGVTGAANLNSTEVAAKLDIIRKHTNLPIAVGFGVRDARSAAAISQIGDAVVVGSVIVNEVERLSKTSVASPILTNTLSDLVGGMRMAMDGSQVNQVK